MICVNNFGYTSSSFKRGPYHQRQSKTDQSYSTGDFEHKVVSNVR